MPDGHGSLLDSRIRNPGWVFIHRGSTRLPFCNKVFVVVWVREGDGAEILWIAGGASERGPRDALLSHRALLSHSWHVR
jgi:hypothetical protein